MAFSQGHFTNLARKLFFSPNFAYTKTIYETLNNIYLPIHRSKLLRRNPREIKKEHPDQLGGCISGSWRRLRLQEFSLPRSFLPNTQVLGVNISGKTPAAANTALKNHFQKQHYAFTDGTKTVATASGEQLGLDQNYSALLKKVKSSQNPWRWTESVIAASKTDALKTPNVNQSALDTYISQTVAKLNATRKAPVNASVQSDANGNFIIQKEVAGNQIDAKKLKAQTLTAISQDKDTVDLTATYQEPAIKSDDSKLKAAVSKLNAISQISGKIQIETHTITIPTATIKSWLSYTNGQVEVSKTGVANYVAALNTKYSTFGLTRKFKSTKLGTVSVPGGTYGWGIDQPKEVESIIAAVKTGKDFTKEVIYTGSGYHKDGTDIGNTYVEVDKTNQHEYVYKDGKLILDSAIVSGKPGQDTPLVCSRFGISNAMPHYAVKIMTVVITQVPFHTGCQSITLVLVCMIVHGNQLTVATGTKHTAHTAVSTTHLTSWRSSSPLLKSVPRSL